MWTILPKDKLDDFIRTYPELNNYDNEFILHETDKYYILPRFFIKNFPHPGLYLHEDKTFNGEIIDIEFSGNLRENQKAPMENLILKYNYEGSLSGILKGRCGFGKTVCTTYLVSIIKKKTMIIIDNQELKKQWIEAFIKFTNLKKEDIGIIQGKSFEIEKNVCIAMVQTLMSKAKNNMKETYSKIKNSGFDFIVMDEVHCVSAAPKFALASLFLNSHNLLGLTATPFGHGVNKLLLDNTIGEVIYEVSDYELSPKINFIKYDSGLGKKHSYRISKSKDYVRMIAFYNSIISESQEYLNKITDISDLLLKNNYRILIITSTIKQVEIIIKSLRNKGLKAIPFHASDKELDKDKDNLLVATYKYVNKGFSYNELSAIIYTLPLKGKTSLIQTAGRIMRDVPGKQQPIIYDLIDTSFGDTFTSTIETKKKIFRTEFGENIIINI